ncbi:2,5-diketo-D-gluconic acid reductase B [Paraliobacillus ryukyuensis]|uniref:Diketogulonate reductase-like aldo/keto reductase n=1 Tax=Paraliobacillus ryukyuensis TaxID=200904 RepID=A0A366E468_9BACI|nr:aldo/keto reductase [Paraliobacillus ryukyuensis]RBO97112.1 diketogulonate reductase-like aldo/keto reductase [Paraliobacillus ryukyuensis]
MTNNIQKWQLNDGNYIPSLGFGTYQLKGNEGATAIEAAINSGYRLLDSAYNYENEGVVGEGIRRSSVPREELVVTSKLPGRYHRYEDAVKTIQESLYRTNLNYYDIYLIHWPNPSQDLYVEAWQALIDAKKWGLIRSIGVCNFLPEHLKRLKEETGVVPAINQIELHPFFNQEEQRKVNDSYNIITQAWSPLYRAKDISDNQILKGIADKYDKSVPQVILRWHYQLGNIAIPKSANPNRQLENKAIFDFKLDESDMMTIIGTHHLLHNSCISTFLFLPFVSLRAISSR